jgi:transposase
MKTINYVGIDVGSKEVVVVIIRNGKVGKTKTFDNTPEGHAAIINYISSNKHHVRVCLESTGTYHFDLAVALSKAKGIEVMVMNPKVVHNFAKALMLRSKTDAIDAQLLAEIASMLDSQGKFEVWQAPKEVVIILRSCERRIVELTRQRARATNQLHALEATASTPEFVLANVRQMIQYLDEQIKSLQQQLLTIIEQDESVQAALDLLITVTGIAKPSAINILGEILILPEDMTARQWVAHAGLDPRQHTSGSSVHQKPRLSKVGNRYLRCALFMPALSAIRHNIHVKAYYNHLVEGLGKLKMQAICAVMRKLLHSIHGILKTKKAFDGAKFYQLPVISPSE